MGFVVASDEEYGYTATLLLQMTTDAGYHVREVKTGIGGFWVPDEISDQLCVPVPAMPAVRPTIAPVPPPGWDEPLPTVDVTYDATDGNYYVAPEALVEEAPPAPKPTKAPDRESIRAWAKENGHDVADFGRLPIAVIEAYNSAQQVE